MFRILLWPISLFYGLLTQIRNFLFDHQIIESKKFNIPIISVGNITIGGTGKTPHVEYLVKLLKDEKKLAVLSRGYKRKTRGFYMAGDNSNSHEIGDEPCQIKKKFPNLIVAVDANRVRGVQRLIEQGVELIILDDAFQHRYIKPGLSILLVDFNRNINEDYLLPYGRLREPVYAKDRADIIIVSKTPQSIKPIDRRIIHKHLYPRPYQKIFFTGLKYGKIKAVFKEAVNNVSLQDLKNGNIVLFTGIAHTKQLLEYLHGFCENIVHLSFPDHANYSLNRINKIIKTFDSIKNSNKIILTTEKDTIKVKELPIKNNIFKQKLFFLPIEVFFIEDEKKFNNQIIDYVGRNKGNR